MKIKLREAAKEFKGWSLYRLAKELGINDQCVYNWANGKRQMSYKVIDMICYKLECSINDLLGLEVSNNANNNRNVS